MYLAVLLTSILGHSLAATRLVLRVVKVIIKIAFLTAYKAFRGPEAEFENIPDQLKATLRHLPIDARTAMRRYDLLPAVTIYACCPTCSYLYPPLGPHGDKPYQEYCTSISLDGRTCGTRLLRSRLEGDRLSWRAIRRYPLRDPSNWISYLLGRPEIESEIDGSIADVEWVSRDIWDSELLGNFLGPDKIPFFNGSTRLSFALAADWFNPYQNMEAKKKWSIGAIYLVCLNLPPHLRFRTENVCLIGVIPGPREPSLEQVNHFIRPIVEAFKTLWDPGMWMPFTVRHPGGRLVRAIILLLIADLLGARHLAGFTFPGHRLFCSYCGLPRDLIDDFDLESWPRRSNEEHRRRSQRWLNAATTEDRQRLTDKYGLRWSAFTDLPYWDPFRQVPVDILHMLLAILSKHARGAWHMSIAVDEGDGTHDPFYAPPDIMTMAKAEHVVETKPKTEISKLKKKVIVELCLRRGIRTGGKTLKHLRQELNEWVGTSRTS